MGIRSGTDTVFRRETLTYQGKTNDHLYYFDPESELWLSVSEHMVCFSRADANLGTEFIRSHGQCQTGPTWGPMIPQPWVVTWLTASSISTPNPAADIEVWSNNASQGSVALGPGSNEVQATPFILSPSASVGSSIGIKHVNNGGTTNQLIVQLGVRWRLP